MSKILITGNGFDLFHHLPTKYGHFMAIMTTIEDCNFSEDVSFEELFGKIFRIKFPNDYKSIVENYNTEKIRFDKNLLLNFKNNLILNSWYKYFKGVLEIETWIDFENELENALEGISIVFNEIKGKHIDHFNYYPKKRAKVFCEFEHFEFAEIQSNDRSVIYFHENFLDSKNMKIKEELILKSMYNSLQDFTNIFNKFLVLIVERFLDQKEFKYSGVDFYLMDKIYTFNYTDVFEKLYGINRDKIVYLHGKMNKIDSSQNLIFGISDIPESLKNNKVFDFTKYYQKIRKNNNCKFIELPLKSKNNLKETIFYIIGHSLDESDAKYIIDLFKYLELDSNKYSKICVFYFNDNDFDSKLNNLIKIIGEEIVVEMNKGGRLYFEELTSDNLKKQFSIVLKESKKIGVY